MPPRPLYDLSRVDFTNVILDKDEIRKINPQRYEFEQLDGIHVLDFEEQVAIGFRHVSSDEFWVRGHIPGNPIFPGVLMLEASAQLCSVYCTKVSNSDAFFGFGGMDKVRFRGTVVPGDRLILVCKGIRVTPRISVCASQGFVGNKLVFEAEITGVSIA